MATGCGGREPVPSRDMASYDDFHALFARDLRQLMKAPRRIPND